VLQKGSDGTKTNDLSDTRTSLHQQEVFSPAAEGKDMQDHQVHGVRWMLSLDARGLNPILADDMGLRKTIQAVAFLMTICARQSRGPHIVLAPKNVVSHWAAEFENFYPKKFKVLTHLGSADDRFKKLRRNLEDHPDFNVLLTSNDITRIDLFHSINLRTYTCKSLPTIEKAVQ